MSNERAIRESEDFCQTVPRREGPSVGSLIGERWPAGQSIEERVEAPAASDVIPHWAADCGGYLLRLNITRMGRSAGAQVRWENQAHCGMIRVSLQEVSRLSEKQTNEAAQRQPRQKSGR